MSMQHPASAADLVRRSDRLGVIISDYQAAKMADAALSWYDDILSNRQIFFREQWALTGFRDYHLQAMRRQLTDMTASQGLVPIALPRETVQYMTGGVLDPDSDHEVPETGDWQTVRVTLEVPVRVPPVDRGAAVKAGVLTGPAIPEQGKG